MFSHQCMIRLLRLIVYSAMYSNNLSAYSRLIVHGVMNYNNPSAYSLLRLIVHCEMNCNNISAFPSSYKIPRTWQLYSKYAHSKIRCVFSHLKFRCFSRQILRGNSVLELRTVKMMGRRDLCPTVKKNNIKKICATLSLSIDVWQLKR